MHHPGEALGEDLHVVDADQIVLPVILKLDHLIPHEIFPKGLFLRADPLDGKPHRQHRLTLRDVPELHLPGQSGYSEDVVVFILALTKPLCSSPTT